MTIDQGYILIFLVGMLVGGMLYNAWRSGR